MNVLRKTSRNFNQCYLFFLLMFWFVRNTNETASFWDATKVPWYIRFLVQSNLIKCFEQFLVDLRRQCYPTIMKNILLHLDLSQNWKAEINISTNWVATTSFSCFIFCRNGMNLSDLFPGSATKVSPHALILGTLAPSCLLPLYPSALAPFCPCVLCHCAFLPLCPYTLTPLCPWTFCPYAFEPLHPPTCTLVPFHLCTLLPLHPSALAQMRSWGHQGMRGVRTWGCKGHEGIRGVSTQEHEAHGDTRVWGHEGTRDVRAWGCK